MKGGSGSTAAAPTSDKSDPAWKYNVLHNPKDANSMTYIFCGKVTNEGIYWAKLHQVGGRRDAKKCLKCPEHVRSELHEYMEKKRQEKVNYDRLPDFDDMDEMMEPEEDAEELDINAQGKRPSQFDKGKGKVILVPHPRKANGK